MERRLGPSKDNPPNMEQFIQPGFVEKRMKQAEEHKHMTGFDTPAEYSAYCLGRHDEAMTIVE